MGLLGKVERFSWNPGLDVVHHRVNEANSTGQ